MGKCFEYSLRPEEVYLLWSVSFFMQKTYFLFVWPLQCFLFSAATKQTCQQLTSKRIWGHCNSANDKKICHFSFNREESKMNLEDPCLLHSQLYVEHSWIVKKRLSENNQFFFVSNLFFLFLFVIFVISVPIKSSENIQQNYFIKTFCLFFFSWTLSTSAYVFVCIYIYIYIYIYQPLRSGRVWHKVNFLAEFNRFEFRVFLLLD